MSTEYYGQLEVTVRGGDLVVCRAGSNRTCLLDSRSGRGRRWALGLLAALAVGALSLPAAAVEQATVEQTTTTDESGSLWDVFASLMQSGSEDPPQVAGKDDRSSDDSEVNPGG